jgi:hypothetical protein
MLSWHSIKTPLPSQPVSIGKNMLNRNSTIFAPQNSVTSNMPIQVGGADEQITVAFAEERIN